MATAFLGYLDTAQKVVEGNVSFVSSCICGKLLSEKKKKKWSEDREEKLTECLSWDVFSILFTLTHP